MNDAEAGLSGSRIFPAAAGLLVASVGLLAYSNSFDAAFTFDDQSNILQNPFLRWRQLASDNLNSLLLSTANRRPVPNLTFALNYYVGRYEVWGYHAVNVAIHVLCGLLVMALGRRLYARLARLPGQRGPRPSAGAVPWLALLAGLLFVAHPLQTQAVTYVVQRMTSLAALFTLAALWLYVAGREAPPGRRRGLAFGLAVPCGLLALGSKENAVTLPFAVWGIEWLFFRDLDPRFLQRSALRLLLPLLGLLFGAYLLAVWGPEWGYGRRSFSMGERLLTQLRVVVFYLSLVAFPHPDRLSLLHEFPVSHSLLDPPSTLLCGLLLLGLLGLTVRAARHWRLVSFALGWFFLHLAVESTLLPLEMAYEHRVYLPLAGLAWLAPFGLLALAGDRPAGRALAFAAAGAGVAALAVGTHARNEVWRSPESLWADAARKAPGSSRAHGNWGFAITQQERHAEALPHFRDALRIDPEDADAHRNLAGSLLVLGQPQEAAAHYRQAMRLNPADHQPVAGLGMVLAQQGRLEESIELHERSLRLQVDERVFNNLGRVLANAGREQDAETYYKLALSMDPDHPAPLANLGMLRASQGNLDEAIPLLSRVLQQVDDPETHMVLGNALWERGLLRPALYHVARAQQLRPDWSSPANNLAWMLASGPDPSLRDPHRAIELAEGELARRGSAEPGLLDTLAVAYASAGRYEEALAHAERAAQLAKAHGADSLSREIAARMDLYRASRPFVDATAASAAPDPAREPPAP